MKNVLTRLPKSVLIPLGLTAAASVTDAATQKNFLIRNECFDKLKAKKWKIKTIKRTKRWISWYIIRCISCRFIGEYVIRKT